MQVFAGDNIDLIMVIKNDNRISANITLVTQIIDPEGVTSAIQESNGVISSADEAIKLVNHWKANNEGIYHVEAFILADATDISNLQVAHPLSEKWSTEISVRSGEHINSHNLRVEIRVDNPENVTSGLLKGYAELVNYGNQSEFIKIQPDGSIEAWPVGIPRPIYGIGAGCEFWPGLELDYTDAFELPAHGRMKLNDGDRITIPYSFLDHADFYELSWNAKLLVQEPDGVNCIYVPSEKVRFNVTAPAYEGINLVLTTDKQSYNRNDTVRFAVQIENTNNEPFRIRGDEIMIHMRYKDGSNLLWFSTGVSDTSEFTIPAHANYSLDHLSYPARPWSWDWDQRNYTAEGMPVVVEPGEYLVYATFSSPAMKSETRTITIE